MKRILLVCALMASLTSVQAQEATTDGRILDVTVDNLVINTHGLTAASENLSVAIDRLSQAFEKISQNDDSFTDEEKQALLNSAQAVGRASEAIEELTRQLPQMSEDFTSRLPQMIEKSQAPIGEISSSLYSASTSVTNIVDNLPEATENSKQLVNAALDSALVRLSIFVVIALVAFALVLVFVLRYVFKTYVEPLVNLMAPLKDAPQHFDNLSQQMEATSENMLQLEKMRRGRWFKPPP